MMTGLTDLPPFRVAGTVGGDAAGLNGDALLDDLKGRLEHAWKTIDEADGGRVKFSRKTAFDDQNTSMPFRAQLSWADRGEIELGSAGDRPTLRFELFSIRAPVIMFSIMAAFTVWRVLSDPAQLADGLSWLAMWCAILIGGNYLYQMWSARRFMKKLLDKHVA